jgi:hypothetical protein
MWFLLLPLLLGTPPSPSPEPEGAVIGKNLKNAVQKYRDALARARWAAGYGSLGGLYSQARTLGPDRSPTIAAETKDFLEKASPAQKQRLVDDLAGLRFSNPDEAPIPDIPFFIELNRTSRERESERFFTLIHGLYAKGTFTRAYEDPKAGCTRLGKDQAVGVARALKSAESKVPHYKGFLEAERQGVIRALTTTCACYGIAESQKEIADFIKAFPKDPDLPTLWDQLAKIAAGDPSLHFQCAKGTEPSP